MGDVFGEPAIVTDTHCIRLVNRIGLVDGIKEPKKVEMELGRSSTGGRKRFLSQTCIPRKGSVHGPHKTTLRQMLSGRYLCEENLEHRDISMW